MRKLLVIGLGTTFLLGMAGCSGGAGDVPTQRGVSLSSGGTSGGGTGGGGNGNGNGNGNNPQPQPDEMGTEPGPAPCQLGAQCDCDGVQGIVTSCDNNTSTCTCSS